MSYVSFWSVCIIEISYVGAIERMSRLSETASIATISYPDTPIFCPIMDASNQQSVLPTHRSSYIITDVWLLQPFHHIDPVFLVILPQY